MLIKKDKRKRKTRISLFFILFIITICGIYYTKRQVKNGEILGTENNFLDEARLPEALENIPPIRVEVVGNVKNPGIYVLNAGDDIKDAVEMAGGFAEEMDIGKDASDTVFDMERIEILPQEQEIAVSYSPSLVQVEYAEEIKERKEAEQIQKININTADAKALESLPHIGEKLAQAILAYRTEHGGFKSIEEIKNVPKIGDKIFDELKDYITIEE